MKTMTTLSAAICALALVFVLQAPAQGKALRVLLDDTLSADKGCLASTHILRACRLAVRENYKYLVIEIDSDTDNLDMIDIAARRISELKADGTTTVAFVRKRCRGAAFYLALHCEKIYAGVSAAFSPFAVSPGEMDEEQKAAVLDALRDAVSLRRPNPKPLLAYLSENPGEWYLITFSREPEHVGGAWKVPFPMAGGVTYVADADTKKMLEASYPAIMVSSKKLSLPSLSRPLSTRDALLLGLVDGEASDYASLASLLSFDETPPLPVEWFEKLAVLLAWPWVLCLLLVFGFLAFFIELHAQGTFIGAGLALLFLGLFFWSSWFIGTVGIVEPILFVLGLLLLAVELLVIPGFGIIGLSGLLLLFYGLFASFFPGIVPSFSISPYDSFLFGMSRAGKALAVLVSSLVLTFTGAVILARFLPETPLFKRLVHDEKVPESRYVPITQKTAGLVGRTGVTATDLKPAGKVKIDGVLYDARSDGGFIPKGRKVKVIDHGFSLVVSEEV